MEQETTLSIIIPLYNCEKYIKHCLDSILAQGLNKSDFEIIIVDDGSVDNSYAIATAYATGHDNIIVVRQENQGVACTRNNALKMAKGNYVTFVDADDMLVGGSLAKLLRIAMENKAEMVKAAHIEVPQEALFESYSCNGSSTELMSGDDAIVKVTKLKEGYCWGYLISRRLIADHNLCFPPKVSFMEDWAFITQAMLKCNTFINSDVLFYLYRRNTTSCVANMSTEKLLLGCRSIDIVSKASTNTTGAVRQKLTDNVCANVNIVLWFTIHYRRIFHDRKTITKVLVPLLKQVDSQFISRSLKPFILFPNLYIVIRHLLAKRKY